MRQDREPLAIVGIGLRLPGGSGDPASFWRFLLSGGDAIAEIPPNRWSIQSFYDERPGIPGKTHSKWGGFIDDHDRFDPAFFSIGQQEALGMDPQQRLLLETTWHAFENSGRIPDPAAGERVGVWVGVSLNDYNRFSVSPIDHVQSSATGSGAFDATGTALSITANRISHFFNLTGPSMAVDTACSSSLVALNEACRALWDGECEGAVVAGVNHIVDPTTWIAFCAMGALSPTGRCKSFDASADGFVRGEGVGVVILKPLSKALADGDRVYASILATAANQDGRTPAIAMPSKTAQRSLIEHALDLAGLSPDDIDFVEAHGTGTPVGDPIEAQAIGEAIGRRRRTRGRLLIGSVKTNIGHLESASGICGLIKAALSLHHRRLPANLHFERPNPEIDFAGMNLEIPVATTTLAPPKGRPLRAGVNSFGFGGANAHAILESAPPPSRDRRGPRPPAIAPALPVRLLALSAASEDSLKRLATAYADRLESEDARLEKIAPAAATIGSRLPCRLAVRGRSEGEIAARLRSFASPAPDSGGEAEIEFNAAGAAGEPPVFVFSGQGSQWAGMGRSLYDGSPVFRAEFDRIASALKRLSGGRLDLSRDVFGEDAAERLARTSVAQPAIFAIQTATARLLESWGIRPAAVVGHSVGEVAAAHIAGALGFEDALRVIYHRGSRMASSLPGRMIALDLSPDDASAAIAQAGGRLSLAARNGPKSVSISGPEEEVERLRDRLEQEGVHCRYVPVDYAFHSALMDPAKEGLVRALAGISPRNARIPLYSSVTGDRVSGKGFGAGYWWRNVRETVRFTEAMGEILEAGHRLFLEINAHPVLQSAMRQHLVGEGDDAEPATALGTLRKDRDDADEIAACVSKLHCLGLGPDWAAFHGSAERAADLPPYPFERHSFWRETPAWRLARTNDRPHPLLHAHLPGPTPQWLVFLDRRQHPFFNDHLVGERIVFPASGYIELALAIGRHHLGDGCLCLESVEFQRVLFLQHQGIPPLLRVEFDAKNGAFAIHSSSDPDRRTWIRHALGKVRKADPAANRPSPPPLSEIKARCAGISSVADTYRHLEESGLRYGPLFRGLSDGGSSDDESWSEIEIPRGARADGAGDAFLLHPVLLDSAFHILALKPHKAAGTFLPVSLGRLRLYRQGATAATVCVQLTSSTASSYVADLTLLDRDGEPIADLRGFRLQAIESYRGDALPGTGADFLEESWVREDLAPGSPPVAAIPSNSRLLQSIRRISPGQRAALSPLRRGLDAETAAALWKQAPTRHPSLTTELLHIERCLHRAGQRSAGDDASDEGAVYRHSLWSRPIRESVAGILGTLVASQPLGRRLEVIELDAATRSSAEWYLSQLPAGSVRYTATDPDPEHLAEFGERLGHRDGLRCLPLDVPAPQGDDPSGDAVLSIYPARINPTRLRRIRRLLRPGGLLLLVVAATEGDDGLPGLAPFTPSPPCLDAMLEKAGFRDIVRHDQKGGPHRFWFARNPVPAATATVPAARQDAPRFLVFADRGGSGAARFVEALARRGEAAETVPFADRPRSREAAAERLRQWSGPVSLVYLGAVGTLGGAGIDTVCDTPLFLSQALDALSGHAPAMSLHVFTCGVEPVPGFASAPNPSHAPLAGFVRVVRSELRSHRIVHADLSPRPTEAEWDLAVADLLGGGGEDQIAYRGESRWLPRIVRRSPANQGQATPRPLLEQSAALVSRQPGILDYLGLQSVESAAPRRGEILVEVHAAGLNFRDVMKALAIYPSDERDAGLLGDDFAGVVVATGPGTRRVKPGDRVVGVFPGCFQTRLTVPEDAIFAIPDALSFEEAATIPSVYLTAWFSLHELAGLRRGERVLVHAGAGGVGLAAIQLALRAGATVYATAGSAWKSRYLRAIGVERVYDSRSLEFADLLLADTGGEGVDIVLNSLAGESISKSLECLREGGRFLELGKRDIYENTAIGLRPFKKCLSYHAIDLSRQFSPSRLRLLFRKLRALVQSGTIRPLPHTVFPATTAAGAFRRMAQGRHLGKIVISFEDQTAAPVAALCPDPLALPADATFLVTGGTRGFGLRTAKFLAERGARHLVLASLGGQTDPESDGILASIRSLGATVSVRACDISDETALSALLDGIRDGMPPLTGVFHAAMVLDDDVLVRMTPARIVRSLGPKARGAWNLHRLTLDDPLEHFVLFSSISVLLGNPGQSNYVAANAFLDTLASYRRHRGLPGLSVAFDRLAESGYAARNRSLAQHFDRLGWKGLSDAEALRGLELLMRNDATRLAVSKIDWSRWRAAAGRAAQSPRFSLLLEESAEDSGEALVERIRQRFFSTAPEERAAVIEEFVTRQVAKVLRVPPARLKRDKPLNEQGLDSLMAVELFGVLENQLGVPVPPSQLIENPTIAKASAAITRVLESQDSHPAPPTGASPSAPATAGSATSGPESDATLLAAEIASLPPPADPAPAVPPSAILLTGATGFFGPYLLDALLTATTAKIHCLVRAPSPRVGWERVERRLREAGFARREGSLRDRLEILPGDIAQERLGLSPTDWASLADHIDTVVHAAAVVGHATGYPGLRQTNVASTAWIAKFAASGAIRKHIHFLSGVGVLGGSAPAHGEKTLKPEHTPPDPLPSLYNDYGRSKAVSEHLLATARAQGIPANVFRLAHLTSPSEPDRSIREQGVWLFLKACLVLGSAPRSGFNLQITPARHTARRIAEAVQQRIDPGVWHVVGSQSTSFDDFVRALRDRGEALEPLDPSDWLRTVRDFVSQNPAYAALMPDETLFDTVVSNLGLLDDTAFRAALPEPSPTPDGDGSGWDPGVFLDKLAGTGPLWQHGRAT